ncbi:NAD(+) synthase [Chondromyces apiculatus]|uniref:Glutamine-dependent NAD(+) synthetase n=1 Tax=Chondromyces apiculatus DSM 436 TaxID=1192034 RepID=A0A017SVM7_9BACT|nr:NAD(+) synthase [Chondromyces apiculatus]EYF00650.1 NAD synthetase [Chondromyces apiculatus DSM 436]
MRLIKIGIASVNSTVGAVRANTDRCIALARTMAADDVTLAVFPEQVIGGYPTEDLIQWHGFVDSQRRELERFAAETAGLLTVFTLGLTVGIGGDLFNCAALVHRGRVVGFTPKEKLPTYNIFYEARTFSRGTPYLELDADGVFCGDRLYTFDFGTIGLEICEDVWSPDGPMRRRCYSGAEVICNLSASPFRAGVQSTRREMIATRAADNQCTVAYANMVGGNDGLVFDGGGLVNQNGRPMLEAPRFVQGYAATVVDLDRTTRGRREASTWRSDLEEFRRTGQRAVPTVREAGATAERTHLAYPAPPPGTTFFLPTASISKASPRDDLLDEFFEAAALGVADYYRKIGAFRSIGIALSGGRDSALSVMVAWRALCILAPDLEGDALREEIGRKLQTFYMPTRYSSDATKGAAAQLARDIGAQFAIEPIEEAFEREVQAATSMLGGKGEVTEITRQNVQARIRGTRMWNWSNSSSALFLQTGNMSEKALGYTTVGGDLEGAFSVIANLPKTVVIALLERLAHRFGFEGLRQTLGTMAGPELAENQSGEAELMPYEVLDACLYLYGAEKLTTDEISTALPSLFPERDPDALRAWAEKFVTLFSRAIFKWVQAPLAVHLGTLDLDRERALQLPVVQRTEWEASLSAAPGRLGSEHVKR